jgi:RNA polymerase sigma-70 factor, ECF subfamily
LPEPAPVDGLIRKYHRRLYVYLRALLPAAKDAEAALRETVVRLAEHAAEAPREHVAEWAERIARQVASERRQTQATLPFSDDMFRQLADSAGPILDQSEARPAVLEEILKQLPPPERELVRRRYELGLRADQIALAENQTPAAAARELTSLHASLIAALRQDLPENGPDPPGGATDLGRMADQLFDGTISEDGRLVLETLLLADAAAQVHYHRHAALVAELTWRFGGVPALPELPRPGRRGLSRREWTVTIAFLVACTIVIGLVTWAVSTWFRQM